MGLISTYAAYVDCGFVINFSVVYLAKAHNYLISSNTT